MKREQMKSIPLYVQRNQGAVSKLQPVAVGVPLPYGYADNVRQLGLCDQQGEPIACDCSVSQTWPDGSPRWVLTEFTLTDSTDAVWLQAGTSDSTTKIAFAVIESPDAYKLTSGEFDFHIARDGSAVLPRVSNNGRPVWGTNDRDTGVCLKDDNGTQLDLKIESVSMEVVGAHSARWRVCGLFRTHADQLIRLELHFKLTAEQILSCRCIIHNASRARHVGGLWDLGDSGSFFFDELTLRVHHNARCVSVKTNVGVSGHTADSGDAVGLLQSSSGGKNWNSSVHIDADGNLPAHLTEHPNGYRLTLNETPVESGERCQPTADVTTCAAVRYQSSVQDFWQNFPSGLHCDERVLDWQLFPAVDATDHELQGGERKSQHLHFSFSDDPGALDWVGNRAVVALAPEAYQQAGVLRYVDMVHQRGRYEELLQLGLSESEGFVAKREAVDEYGWRHFGEIYADHETAFAKGDATFVSHYNNQYDPVYGFARQFALSSEPVWHDLMQSLASHVMDIDIYRTTLDRAEYNNGLFWHTDHYKQAFTCTHRTFSRHQYADDWTGPMGGGPGPEHCYTSGLKLYSLMTGDQDARDTVLALTAWITAYYEGSNTLLEWCLGARQDLKQILALLKGTKAFRYRYPFSRGTGNYIRAMLDSFELTGEGVYLKRVESVIVNSFGPQDDMSMRGLDDVENTWYYTVFLQEVIHYLDVKRERAEFDEPFEYARQSLLYYARWMVEHEAPSLEYSKLEYPNDTWVAQDIRKVEIFYAAYCYATSEREIFLHRAVFFRDYVIDTLRESDTAHYARLQIILLQNHGPSGLLHREVTAGSYSDGDIDGNCLHTLGSCVSGTADRFLRALVKFNPVREIRWMKTRLQ